MLALSCLDSTRADGGAEEDRTPDPLRARQVLSQLSYGPNQTSCIERMYRKTLSIPSLLLSNAMEVFTSNHLFY